MKAWVAPYAALLSATEVGLGSALHALHIPLTGQFLSINQSLLLADVTLKSHETMVGFYVSNTAAALKSLSPIGKKLTPMIALSMQGLLFTLGPWLFGANILGACFGIAFSAIWAFLQPLILYSLIFGFSWTEISKGGLTHIPLTENFSFSLIALTLVSLYVLKLLFTLWLFYWTQKSKLSLMDFLQARWPKVFHRSKSKTQLATVVDQTNRHQVFSSRENKLRRPEGTATRPLRLLLKDLTRPIFIVSVALTLGILWLQTNDEVVLAWNALRILCLALFTFVLLRWFPLHKIKNPYLQQTLLLLSDRKKTDRDISSVEP